MFLRLNDYLEVVQQTGDLKDVEALGNVIIGISTTFLEGSPSNESKGLFIDFFLLIYNHSLSPGSIHSPFSSDEVYELILNLQSATLCSSVCGQEAVIFGVSFLSVLFTDHFSHLLS